jgi:hypothetical protein
MRRLTSLGIASLACLTLLFSTEGHSQISNPQDNIVLNILGRWYQPAQTNHISTISPSETPGGGTFEGQTFYIPATPAADRHTFYRLFSSPAFDHMDSTVPGEGGYSTEGPLGYLYNTQVAGTAGVRRWYSPSAQDHLTGFVGETPGGYQGEAVMGYGYPRFGNQGEVPLSVQGSQVRVVANQVAGGAISELWWNGKQFVNDYDFGRQIQIAFNLQLPGETNNPTEGGDKHGWPGVKPAGWAHGSPLIGASIVGTTLQTTCQPLQWSPENFGGGPNNPVIWKGTIGKQLDLDFAGFPRVIRWITNINFPSSSNFLDLEIVTAYLNSEFNTFYAYNAATNVLDSMTAAVPNNGCLDPSQDARLRPAAGGVLISTSDNNFALGVYRKDAGNNFGLCKFLGSGSTGKYGFQTTKWNTLFRPGNGVTAGAHSYTAYLVVGTRDQVRTDMRNLYLQGY